MNWVREYLEAIRSGYEVVGRKIRTVYERECSWMENPPENFPYYFDEKHGERHIEFIETFCKHSKGKYARRPLLLELFQKAKIQLVFGWREKETDFRRIREVIDIRGRKCGKTTETAGIEWDMLLNDGESGAEIYCTANKKDQARLIFDEAVNMRSQSPALAAVTQKRQSDIYFPATFSFIKALAADTKTMDGLNAHFFCQDEFHEARTRKIYDVMKQSQSAREQPLAWLISTNGFVREQFFDETYTYASSVALWEEGFHDYRLLPLIYELDEREEWTKPECWAKANPGLGKIKSVKTLAENVEKAKRDPGFLPTVLTKDFNIPENSADSWLTYEQAVNEKAVGRAMKKSGIAREEIFLETKLWPSFYNDVDAVEKTLQRLDTDTIDLLLIHQPAGNYIAGYRLMEQAYKAGKVRAIGLSNFNEEQIREILSVCEVRPAVLQTEIHPYSQEKGLKEFLSKEDIVIQAWYPLGHGDAALLQEPVFAKLAEKYGKSNAQIILRWHIQAGNVVIPGSKNPEHIRANFDLFDFELTAEEMQEIQKLNKDKRYYTSTPELLKSYAEMVPSVDEQV